MILDGNDICIYVKMIISNHLHRAGDDVVGGVFDDFKFFFIGDGGRHIRN